MSERANTWMGFPVYDRSNWPPDSEQVQQGGVVLVDKHLGATSFTVVRRLRRFLDIKKVGHAGTLDPAAEGLLIVCFGKATKTIEHIQELPKTYIAGILLGRETPSYDRETPTVLEMPTDHITLEMVDTMVDDRFTGEILQIPPVYSALKVEGQPMYKKARKGETVEVKPRSVVVHSWSLIKADPPLLLYEVTCSKGTYIRSLAYDLGRALGTCGMLASLRRTRTGHFSVENALLTSDFEVKR